jgi:hypothetical protein
MAWLFKSLSSSLPSNAGSKKLEMEIQKKNIHARCHDVSLCTVSAFSRLVLAAAAAGTCGSSKIE